MASPAVGNRLASSGFIQSAVKKGKIIMQVAGTAFLPAFSVRHPVGAPAKPSSPATTAFGSSVNFSRHSTTPLDKAVFTVLDCESTGLDTGSAQLLELTAIRFRNGRELERFSTLVKPTMRIPLESKLVTGIDDAMVANAPSEQDALRGLCEFLGPAPLIVGDFPGYDMDLIPRRLQAHGLAHYQDRFVLEDAFCTRKLGHLAEPTLRDTRASKLAQHWGLPALPHHRAENDVRNAALVLFELIRRIREVAPDCRTVGDLKDLQGDAWSYGGS